MAIIDKINIDSIDYDIAVKGENVSGSVAAARTLDGLTTTVDELNYSSGLTGNVQDQLDKLNNAIVTTDKNVLENSKVGGYRLLELDGNTEQKTYIGKNLINIDAMVNSSLVNNNDGSYTLTRTTTDGGSRFSAVQPFIISAGTTLHLSLKRHNNNTGIQLLFQNSSGDYPHNIYIGNWGTEGSVTITDENITGICLCVLSEAAVGDSVTFSEAQLEIGDTATEYEPYCGGIPSPNPSNPQPILNTFDCVEMIQGWMDSNGVYQPNYDYVIISKNKIPCKSGDVLKIKTENAYTYFNFYFFLGNTFVKQDHNTFITDGVKEHSVTVPNGVDSFYCSIQNGLIAGINALSPDTAGKIQLTINGKYVGCVKTHGVNQWDEIVEIGDISSSTGVNETRADMLRSKNYIDVIPTNSYFLTSPYTIYIRYYGKNRNYLSAMTVNANSVFTVPSDCYYIRFCIATGYGTTYKNNISINYPSTITEYEPYKETIAHFLTTYPLMQGSTLYKENGLFKVEHEMKSVMLKDIGTWAQYPPYAYCYYCVIDDSSIGYQTSKCTHFTNVDAAFNGTDILYCDHPTLPRKYFTTEYENIDDFVEWVGSSNAELQYTLATPIIETLDTDSQLALNSLETFDTVTYIEVDSRVKPLSIKGEYGTSQVGAYTLKSLNNTESNAVRLDELAVALVSQ